MATVDLRERMKALLLDSAGVGKTTGGGGAVDHARARDWSNFVNSQEGQYLLSVGAPLEPYFEQKYYGGALPFKYGQRPDPTTIDRWMDKVMPGSRQGGGSQRQTAGGGRTGTAGSPLLATVANRNPQNDLLMQLLTEAERERLAAKQANIDKFDRGDMMFQNRTNQVMNEIANWGEAGKIDLNERARDTLNAQLARNAANGLGNSSLESALTQRNAMDLAREQLRHSENISNRKATAYADLEKDHADFVERRDDVPPDMGQIYALAQQLGQAGGGQGYAPAEATSIGDSRQLNGQSGQRPVMTPWGPVQKASPLPGMLRGPVYLGAPTNPMGLQAAALGTISPQRPLVGSSRYPRRRSPLEYVMIRAGLDDKNEDNKAESLGKAQRRTQVANASAPTAIQRYANVRLSPQRLHNSPMRPPAMAAATSPSGGFWTNIANRFGS